MAPVENHTAAQLSGAFSTAVFKELAREFPASDAQERVALVASGTRAGLSLGQAFDEAHRLIARSYRNEYVFKNDLISRIVFGRHSPNTASALLELRMGRSWADLLIVNGTSTTYEIKTDLDQFGRLTTQLSDYTSRSEYVNVVTSCRRAAAAERYLPDHVGIVAIRSNGSTTTIRAAESNLERLITEHMYAMLRADEALEILEAVCGYTLDVPKGRAWTRMRELFAELPSAVAHQGVIKAFRKRSQMAASLASQAEFPTSLRALAYGTNLSSIGQQRLLSRLASPAELAIGVVRSSV